MVFWLKTTRSMHGDVSKRGAIPQQMNLALCSGQTQLLIFDDLKAFGFKLSLTEEKLCASPNPSIKVVF